MFHAAEAKEQWLAGKAKYTYTAIKKCFLSINSVICLGTNLLDDFKKQRDHK